jgi:hypothetical protein
VASSAPERHSIVWRGVVFAVLVEHVLLVIAPLNVLSPDDPHRIGAMILHGRLPYRDFLFEYPPLAVIAFILPGLLPDRLGEPAMAVQAVILEMVVVAVLRKSKGAVARYALLSLLIFPFLSGGFDAFPMAAIAVSTALLAAGEGSGWLVAAAGGAIKLAPFAAWVWARRPLVAGAIALCAGLALCASALLVTRTAGDSYIGFSLDRGVEVESLAASTAWIGQVVQGEPSRVVYRFRSNELDGAAAAAVVWEVVAAGALLVLGVACGRDGPEDPWLASFAAVLILLCGFKVFSPQFIAWPAPLAAVLGRRWFWSWMAVCGTTFAVYTVGGSNNLLFSLVLIRNVAVLAVAGAALWTVLRRGRARTALAPA